MFEPRKGIFEFRGVSLTLQKEIFEFRGVNRFIEFHGVITQNRFFDFCGVTP